MTTTELYKHVATMESYLSQLQEIDQTMEQCTKDDVRYVSLPDIPVPCNIAYDLLNSLRQHIEDKMSVDIPYEVRTLLDE